MDMLMFLCLLGHSAFASAQINLGSAAPFAVLSGATITNTGPSLIQGDIGTGGVAITGFPPGAYSASQFTSLTTPLTDATSAYNAITPFSGDDLTGLNLGGLVLGPGTYSFSSAAQLTGSLTLVSSSSSNSSWYFKIGSALTTASGSSVLLQGTAQAHNVYWQVGSSATFGAATKFAGLVLAGASITMVTGSTSDGGLFALGGSVTLDTNEIQVAEYLVSPSTIVPASSIAGGGGGGDGGFSSITSVPRSLLASIIRVDHSDIASSVVQGDRFSTTIPIQNGGPDSPTTTTDLSGRSKDLTKNIIPGSLYSKELLSNALLPTQREIYTSAALKAETETEIPYSTTTTSSFETSAVLGTKTLQGSAASPGFSALAADMASTTAINGISQKQAPFIHQTYQGTTGEDDQYIDFVTSVGTFIATASCTLQHSPAEVTMVGQDEAGDVETITKVEAATMEETCTCLGQYSTAAVSRSARSEKVSATSLLDSESRATPTDIVTSPSETTSTVSVPTRSAVVTGQGTRTNWFGTILGCCWVLLFVCLAF